LQREQRKVLRRVRRHEGFRAHGGEVPAHVLPTDRTSPTTTLTLDELDAPFDAVNRKSRADLVAFELGVRVVGVRPTGRQLAEEPVSEVERTPQIGADLLESDRNAFRAMFLLGDLFAAFFAVMMHAGARGHAILAVVVADRRAKASTRADPRKAGAERLGFRRAVG